jgi:hypothetical protein
MPNRAMIVIEDKGKAAREGVFKAESPHLAMDSVQSEGRMLQRPFEGSPDFLAKLHKLPPLPLQSRAEQARRAGMRDR